MRLLPLLPLAALAACGANPPAAQPPVDPPAADPPVAAYSAAVHLAADPPVPAHVPAATAGEWTGAPLPPPDSADYAVYAAVLRAFAQTDESFFVLLDSTRVLGADLVAQSLVENAISKAAPEAQDVVGRLFYVNEQPYALQPALPLDGKYRLMPETEFRALFGLGPAGPFYPHPVNGWAALRDRHRGAAGRYEFSRVAYDWTSRTALVFVRLRCGNICEQNHYVVLRRREGEWKVGESISLYSDGDDHTYDSHDAHGMRDTVVAQVRQEADPPAQAPAPVVVPPR
jgi:hypothetical protein